MVGVNKNCRRVFTYVKKASEYRVGELFSRRLVSDFSRFTPVSDFDIRLLQIPIGNAHVCVLKFNQVPRETSCQI